jgi:hypothetical protein
MCNILDTTSGVNTAATAYAIARGDAPPASFPASLPAQRDGVYYLNVYGDIYSRLDDGEGVGAILMSYVKTVGSPHAWAYFRGADPAPWVMATWGQISWFVRAVRRKLFGAPK